MNPAVPRVGILMSQPSDRCPDVRPGRRSASSAAHGPGGPAAADDVAMPAYDRVRGDQQQPQSLAPCFRYDAEQGSESRARSAQSSFGRRGCRRCSTARWWRRIKISAVFHISSRRDSRNPRGDPHNQQEDEPQAHDR
jgi:hypothetical protein